MISHAANVTACMPIVTRRKGQFRFFGYIRFATYYNITLFTFVAHVCDMNIVLFPTATSLAKLSDLFFLKGLAAYFCA